MEPVVPVICRNGATGEAPIGSRQLRNWTGVCWRGLVACALFDVACRIDAPLQRRAYVRTACSRRAAFRSAPRRLERY